MAVGVCYHMCVSLGAPSVGSIGVLSRVYRYSIEFLAWFDRGGSIGVPEGIQRGSITDAVVADVESLQR